MRFRRRLAMMGVLLIAAGCEQYAYVPVSGRITMDGKPLAKVQVRFQPVGGTMKNPNPGRGSIALTDEDGRFTLRVNPKQAGAVVGNHRVAVSRQIGYVETIRSVYNSDSKLTFEVPAGGTDAANFELTSK